MIPGRALAALGLVAAAALAAPSSAAAVPAAEAIAKLNAQRTAHGIPAGIVENVGWSQACGRHNEYQQLNGVLTHEEVVGRPGYTLDGAAAARQSVLGSGASWVSGNPFERAPIHLSQLLAPRLSQMGMDERAGYTCATTVYPDSRNRPAPPQPVIHTYPGNGATHRASEVAFESPFTPGELVGIPERTRTGPYLYVLPDGPWPAYGTRVRIDAASLASVDGPVELRTADAFTRVPTDASLTLGSYTPPAAFVIPVTPLVAGTRYQASVRATVSASPAPVQHTWSFITEGTRPQPPKRAVSLAVARARRKGRRVIFTIKAGPLLAGRRATARFARRARSCRRGRRRRCRFVARGRPVRRGVTLRPRTTISVRAPARGRRLRLTVTVPRFMFETARVGPLRASRSWRGRGPRHP